MSDHANKETRHLQIQVFSTQPITMDSTMNISALNEDIIVEQLLRTHDPDGRWIDSKTLLQEVEAILSFVLECDVSSPPPWACSTCLDACQ